MIKLIRTPNTVVQQCITYSRRHALTRLSRTKTTVVEPVGEKTTNETKQDFKVKKLPTTTIGRYLSLTKPRLSSVVMITTVFGYSLAPGAFIGTESLLALLYTTVGTTLAVGSANTLNQAMEADYDKQMVRTQNRPIPSGAITRTQATIFGVSLAVAGGAIMTLVNPLSTALVLGNVLLYTLVYTPLKRVTLWNTWVGGFVGAIPPLIGWVACTGTAGIGGWSLFYILYIWQISHFLALSWPLRHDYASAGYKMLSGVNPEKLPLSTFRYCLYHLPFGILTTLAGVTTWPVIVTSSIANAYLVYQGYKFWKKPSNSNARKLYLTTIWYIPLLMLLMFLSKTALDEEEEEEGEGDDELIMIQGDKDIDIKL